MKVGFIGIEGEGCDHFRALLQEVIPNSFELVASSPDAKLPEADIYLWDFRPEVFSGNLAPEIVKRTLFVIEPEFLQRFRERLGAMRASILPKPVRSAALRPFLEHAVRQFNIGAPVSSPEAGGTPDADGNQALDCLLHASLKLQEYDQSRMNLLTRAARDFRGPLTALSGYCGLLADQRLGLRNTSQVDLLSRMQHSITRLSRVADAMFELSVGRNVKREPELETGDVEATISHAIQEVLPHADEKQIRITVRVEAPHQPLLFDSEKMEQLLINLLENACKFTPKRGAIHVSGYPLYWNNRSASLSATSESDGDGGARTVIPNAYRIDVRDSGSGIPREHLESLFEEYTSYSGGADRSGGGLGLAICRMIVDAHRGSIWAESGPDETQFSVVLPQPMEQDARLGVENLEVTMARKSA